MRELQIVKYPDPVLLKKAARVERLTPEIRAFIDEMQKTMREENGVGLAAPQVGVSLRIIVVEADDRVHALINPQIITREGGKTTVEGCLSLPLLYGEVKRAEQVTVTGTNPRGKKITLSGENLWARAVQHEIDHLDGVLFIDRVIPESLYWLTADTDEEGNSTSRPTSLEEAKKFFERQAMALRA
jgi:peptide deformylase